MLDSLTIQNIVLIEMLHIDFEAGLCVLTGETGAGKSILLDALSLALGARTDARLLRQGALKAHIIATFSLSPCHSFWQDLEDRGISYEGTDIIFRRLIERDGKSKCFLNDQPISQTLMRHLGQKLVEFHGQFDRLLDAKSQLAALDAYGKLDKVPLQEAFKVYQARREELQTFQERLAKAVERQTFLCFAIEEIEKAAPRPQEEGELESERALVAHRAKIADVLLAVNQNLSTALSGLSQSHKDLCRIHSLLPEKMKPLIEATDRAMLESQDVFEGMQALKREVEGTPHSLEALENRLYALRALGRKYQTDNLLTCLKNFKEELSALEQRDDHFQALETAVSAAKEVYRGRAHHLSDARKEAALRLQTAVLQELPPLKLDPTKFRIHFEELSEEAWGPSGMDRAEFYIQPNVGLPEGPLTAIASGGEFSRFMLALKVVLVQSSTVPTLIFDEIESGTGGAVASAMGERLKVLSQNIQILAITHSPQMASHGTQHLVVSKRLEGRETKTHVKVLNSAARGEEIARMLSGEEITAEARAAAHRLIENSR